MNTTYFVGRLLKNFLFGAVGFALLMISVSVSASDKSRVCAGVDPGACYEQCVADGAIGGACRAGICICDNP